MKGTVWNIYYVPGRPLERNAEMRADILERVSLDLLPIPPLIFRRTRRRLVKATLADVGLDITPHHFETMRALEEERTLHVAALAESLQVARTQMTQLMDKLVALDIVERQVDPDDRRTLNITLTARGKVVLD